VQLLHGRRADVAPVGSLGVLAALVCRHQCLSLDAELA
jgi:hypothetical protein